MLKILVVDDNPAKYSFFQDSVVGKFSTEEAIEVVGNLKDALQRLTAKQYDVLIVDMMLPSTAWSSSPLPSGGIELLNHLIEDDSLNVPKYVVGITSAAEVSDVVQNFFDQSPWVLIRNGNSGEDWQGRLNSLISHAYEAEAVQQKVEYDFDICIITALPDPEQRAVLQLPIAWAAGPLPIDSNTFVRTGTFKAKTGDILRVVLGCSMRMGSTEAALLSYKLIAAFRPRILAMAGICAGMEKKVNFGDAILASPVWDWTSAKWDVDDEGNDRILPAPHYLEVDREVTARFRLLQDEKAVLDDIRSGWQAGAPETPLRVHIGPSASGPIVVADGKTLQHIKTHQNRDVVGLEMEAYGVYYSARYASHPQPKVLSVKSVCDFGDPRKNDAMQKYAAYTSARVLYEFLYRYAPDLAKH